MKKFLIGLSLGLAITLLPNAYAIITPPVTFSDVEENDWFYEPVSNLARWNFIKGYSDGSFRPQDKINRAESAKIINDVFNQVYIGPEFTTLEDKFEALSAKVSTLDFPGDCFIENKWYSQGDSIDGMFGCNCLLDGRINCPNQN